MAAVSHLFAVTVDCPDPLALARFYQAFTGLEISWSSSDFVVLSGDGDVRIDFQRVANHRAFDWPDRGAPRRVHLDFRVDDLDEAEENVLDLGARLAIDQPGGARFRVLIDPVGHPFCLVDKAAAETPRGQWRELP
jgi:predicted enzyme related to lactoylglutathione lyase